MVSPYAEFTVYHPKPGLRTAAAVRRQTIRRHEGAAFDAIFLLLIGVHEGGRCQSPRRSRGRRPARPAVPARSGSRRKGQRLLPDTPSPVGCGACTLGFGQSATFHLTGGRGGDPRLLLPVRHHSRSFRPRLLGPATSLCRHQK